MESCCECGNELSGSIKCLEVVDYLHKWRPLDKYSASWSELALNLVILKNSALNHHHVMLTGLFAAIMNLIVFSDATLCNLISRYESFGDTCCFFLQGICKST
jgi:hypothetical protein